MKVEILNDDFETLCIIDNYISIIWTVRYNSPGDFELYLPFYYPAALYFLKDNYVKIDKSEILMIIESVVYQDTTGDTGKTVKITGRSVESILDRRIIYGVYDASGNFQDVIADIFNKTMINPEESYRKIPGFSFERSTDSRITDLTIDTQYDCDSVLTIIQDYAQKSSIGWKIICNNGLFIFSLYAGIDRSYSQNVRPYVIFSPEFENIIESTYTIDEENYKSFALVEGEFTDDEGETEKIYVPVGIGSDQSGLLRREMYINGTSVQKEEWMSKDEYINKLDQFGKLELFKYGVVNSFDGKYETVRNFKYGEDFVIGDIVQVKDSFGNQSSARIVEFIISENTSDGLESYPTFKVIE